LPAEAVVCAKTGLDDTKAKSAVAYSLDARVRVNMLQLPNSGFLLIQILARVLALNIVAYDDPSIS
jgi:hypothetical protein